jgi:hypothetical protein
MMSIKIPKPSRPTSIVGPRSTTGNAEMRSSTVPSHDRIRDRAYELYESRGRESGQEEQDWFRAEQEILKRKG